MKNYVKVFAPATVANVGCGFDILGFAVNKPGDVIELMPNDIGKVRIVEISGDEGKLPKEADNNTAGVAIHQYLEHLQIKDGIDVKLHKQMPLGSGLGSSAASAVAAVFAVNELMEKPLTTQELLPFAMEGERFACGSAHADNVAPSLLGGFVLIRSYDPLDVVKIPTPVNLFCTLVYPHIEIKTRDARDLLKKQILLKDAVIQWGNIAGLMAGLMQSDYDLIGRSMHDVIIEPIRSILIPGFDKVKAEAMAAGAIGCGISGSGPTLFALSSEPLVAEKVGDAMSEVFKKLDIDNNIFVSKINHTGPQILQIN